MKNAYYFLYVLIFSSITLFTCHPSQFALYAPWRESWINTIPDKELNIQPIPQSSCVFCGQLNAHNDAKYLILRRFEYHAVFLNLYPYSKGHLLIIPYQHVCKPSQLTAAARSELIEITSACTDLIQKIFDTPGANIGINLGRVAGASIPDHMHVQIVPRKYYDSSFIHVIGSTDIISWDLQKLYEQLKPLFQALSLSAYSPLPARGE